jgi:uncharacterized membrane protein YphA (DoxX/SURF4 family)
LTKVKKAWQYLRELCVLKRKAMDTILWICQSFLALVFLYSGAMKSTQSRQWLVTHNQTGVADISMPLIRFIGITEILGSAGIILPELTQVAPILTPVTAICFAILMVLAAPIHYRRREFRSVAINVFIFLVSVFVAWGKMKME